MASYQSNLLDKKAVNEHFQQSLVQYLASSPRFLKVIKKASLKSVVLTLFLDDGAKNLQFRFSLSQNLTKDKPKQQIINPL